MPLRRAGTVTNTALCTAPDQQRTTPRRAARCAASGARESALQQRLDPLLELLERGRASDHLAVDEEGRGRADLQHLVGIFEVVHDLLSDRWIVVDTGFYGLLAGAGLCADPVDGGKRSAHQIVLRLEQ